MEIDKYLSIMNVVLEILTIILIVSDVFHFPSVIGCDWWKTKPRFIFYRFRRYTKHF